MSCALRRLSDFPVNAPKKFDVIADDQFVTRVECVLKKLSAKRDARN
jgi:hypothetical protein